MIEQIRAVALNTFRETVRDKLFYLVGLFGLILVGSSAVLAPLTLGAQKKIVVDVGLAAMSLLGLVVVVLVGSNMVRKELDKHTITTILAKPVTRRQYILGKFLGLNLTLACMLTFMAVLFLVVLVVSRVPLSFRYLSVFFLTFLELVLINAAVVLFSTFVSSALAAIFTICFFVMGHLSDSIMRFGQMMGEGFQAQTTQFLYYLIPNLELFNVRGAVVHGDPVGWDHLGVATLYGLCYTALLLYLAGTIFSRKELR